MLKTKKGIKNWLESMEVQNFTIMDDLTVNVHGNVYLNDEKLYEIPIQFGIVGGNFSCLGNNLKSLKGSPFHVLGYVDCCHNKLQSLEHSPKEIYGDFFLSGNEINSFEGGPEVVSKNFIITSGLIKNFDGFTTKVGGSLIHKINRLEQCIPSFEHRYFKGKGSSVSVYELVIPSNELQAIVLQAKLNLELVNDKPNSKKIKL